MQVKAKGDKCGTRDARYVPEPGQHYREKRDEHQRDVTNRQLTNVLYSHIRGNEGNKIDWEGCACIDKVKN